jgi:two-component system phosphate regulon sensor histidine kinase PhoR
VRGVREGRVPRRLYLPLAGVILLTTALVGWLGSLRIARAVDFEVERRLRHDALLLRELALEALRSGEPGDLPARLRRLGQETGLRLTVVSADGRTLADSKGDAALTTGLLERPEVLRSQEDPGLPFGTDRRTNVEGVPSVFVAHRAEEGGRLLGYTRAALPVTDAGEELRHFRGLLVGAGFAAAGVGLLLALVIARGHTRRLRAITEAARAIASGDWSRRVPAAGRDEVAALGRAFEAMTGRLRAQVEALGVERRETRAILSAMVEGVVAVDRRERLVLANAAGERILGFDAAASTGRVLGELVRLPEVTGTLAAAVREGAPRSAEVRRPERGHDRVLLLHASPLRDDAGEPAGAVLVLHDITELRQLEAVRRDFVANASHELRTPLAAVRGAVETVLDDAGMDEATRRHFLGVALTQVERLAALVDEMLALSRVEGGGGPALRERVDLRGPVREAVQALEAVAAGRGVRLEPHLPPDALPVLGDAEALRRVAANLVDNALKWSPEAETVRVRVRAEGDAAVLEVEDAGPGVLPADRDRIFERFYRVDRGRARGTGGTGLGLAIVKHLVQAMGGEVGVVPAPGGGSLFVVRLPRAPASS